MNYSTFDAENLFKVFKFYIHDNVDMKKRYTV